MALPMLMVNCVLVMKMVSYAHIWRNTRLIGKKIFDLDKANKEIYSIIGENEISSDVR